MTAQKKAALLFLTAAVLLASGCTLPNFQTGGQTSTSSKGLMIQDFHSDFARVYPEEELTLNLKMKNMGTFEAGYVHLRLGGLEGWTYKKYVASFDELNKRRILEPMANEERCVYKVQEGNGYRSVNLVVRGPSEEFGTEGEEKTCTWTIVSPKLPNVREVSYIPRLTLYYDYSQATLLSVNLLKRSEMRKLMDTGGEVPSTTLSTGDSPVSLSLSTKGAVVATSDGTVDFPLEIKVSNRENGIICFREPGKEGGCEEPWKYSKVSVVIESPDAQLGGGCTNPISLNLLNSKEGTVVCRLSTELSEVSAKQLIVKATAYYRYYIEAETAVTVQKKP